MMNVKRFGCAAAALAVSSLLVMGCGGASKTADRVRPGALQGDFDPQQVIQAANFDAIQSGASIGDVEALYGQEGKLVGRSIVNGIYTYTYQWQDGPYKILNCTFSQENRLNNPIAQAKLVSKELLSTDALAEDRSNAVTKDQYVMLKLGMNLTGVSRLFGMEGVLLGENMTPGMETKTYGWTAADGKVARVTFQEDKLISAELAPALVAYRIVK